MELLSDFKTSVEKAFDEIDPKWRDYEGLVICGTHQPKLDEVDTILDKIKSARERQVPILGICYGLQLMAIEYAKNVLSMPNATSEEFGIEGDFVVVKRPEGLKVGEHNGETYWNNYEVEPWLVNEIDKFKYSNKFQFYEGVQYHPEYQSSKDKPHPLLVRFLNVCKS